ncbi:MAG TPA: site-2 protease family protein [Dehalococcoidia bacterium]|nr:site-2 protease family protein [Dehalococcoidia bacterium]
MIFIYNQLINTDFSLFLVLLASTLLALLVGIGFHEFSHAFAADTLGDTLPGRQGRVTLNPFAHLDPAGTLLMLFVGFGWGKPVQFNPFGLKVSPRTATLLVSAAGPLSNFVAAGLLALPIKLGWVPYINPLSIDPRALPSIVQTRGEYIGVFLTSAVYFNVILGVFNLLPIHPLDGFKVALGILPDELADEFAKLARYGAGILAVLIFLPFLIGYSPLTEVMGPSVRFIVHGFTGAG